MGHEQKKSPNLCRALTVYNEGPSQNTEDNTQVHKNCF